ncbi:hypothetical protein AA313_de0208314 [Arthrobotrys entomopaga]|nr:hypothetical protein AA313_de0208314 [Arthrobotrys entomopaga]
MSDSSSSSLLSYLPQTPGLLPKFLLFVSIVSVANSFQCYATLKFTKRVYSGKPFEVNGLSSRTFGTWTLLAALIRFYAAYNINNGPVYDICIGTFALAGWHFGTEWLYFGTALYAPHTEFKFFVRRIFY